MLPPFLSIHRHFCTVQIFAADIESSLPHESSEIDCKFPAKTGIQELQEFLFRVLSHYEGE